MFNIKGLLLPLFFLNSFVHAQNVGINYTTPRFPLSFAPALGDKISLWDDGNAAGHNFGIGIQSSLLQIHTYTNLTDVAIGYGSSNSFTENFRFKGNGNMGIGLANPGAKLSIAANGAELAGSAMSTNFRLTAGNLNAAAGSELHLGSFGFLSGGNNTALGIRAFRASTGTDWTSTALLLQYDVDNSPRPNGYLALTPTGRLGINTVTPAAPLDVLSNNNWDLTNTEGDFRIGNSAYRLKMGIALGGGGAGATGIMQSGGIGALNIGAGGKYQLQLNGSSNFADFTNISGGLRMNGNAGSTGQVLTSKGAGAAPEWSAVPATNFMATNTQIFSQSATVANFSGFIVVPGISQTITTPAGKAMLIVKGQMRNNGCFACGLASCKYDIWIDGILVDRSIIMVGNEIESVVTNGATFYNLTAGPHKFEVYVDGNGNNFTAYGFRLVYMLLPL